MSLTPRLNRRAFTLIEAAAVAACVGTFAIALIASAQDGKKPNKADETKDALDKSAKAATVELQSALLKARQSARQIKDATQIRGIHQGLVLFAASNRDKYPIPSELDSDNKTIKSDNPASKDITANIYSALVYANYFSPELLVSPAEQNHNIVIDTDYQLVDPKSAVDPKQALWDPAFSADFTSVNGGNTSYAHHIPASERRARWATTFNASEPTLGTRGPKIDSIDEVKNDAGELVLKADADKESLSYHLFGEGQSWKGNIAFNDNHVEFLDTVLPRQCEYQLNKAMGEPGPTKSQDALFYDEPDAKNQENAYLSIFTKAGKTTKSYRAIWD